MSTSNINDLPVLSNEDVELLYEIITAAQEVRAPPFRALFAAYDQVLARNGISKDTDQIYFRFLLRMREGRKAGDTLFEQFRSLLAAMDIQVRIDEERMSEPGEAVDSRRPMSAEPETEKKDLLQQPRTISRRVSFESGYDTLGEDRHAQSVSNRPSPQRARSTDAVVKDKLAHQAIVTRLSTSVRSRENMGRVTRREPPAVQLVGKPANANPRGPVPSGAESNAKYHGQHLSYKARESQFNEGYSTESASNYSGDVSDGEETEATDLAVEPMELNSRTPLSRLAELDNHAKNLRYYHNAARALRIFRQWLWKTPRSASNHANMLNAAQARDSHTLIRQSFDQWRSAHLERKQQRETEKFFDALETRASQAHNKFLLQKAFTHWAQCASEELEKTSAARQHLLKTKYFNAWRDITVVNELKVRRNRLSKFFGLWKRRSIKIFQQQENAEEFYSMKSVERLYRQWFWNFCERRVPSWYEAKLRSSILVKWVEKLRNIHDWTAWANSFRHTHLLGRALAFWTGRKVADQKRQEDAVDARRRRLVTSSLEALRQELLLAPLQRQALYKRDTRVARSALLAWSNRTRESRQASVAKELRVMRNAWTQWNDLLRCRSLSRTIDDRVVLQALYKWVLQERLVLFQRVHRERVITTAFSKWKQRSSDLSTSLGQAKHLLTSGQDRSKAISVIVRWSANAQERSGNVYQAQTFRDAKLKESCLQRWIESFRSITRHDNWAADARFYVLASRSVKQWVASTENSRRIKRREAYATLRRKNKMQLARQALQKWRIKSTSTSAMHITADQFQHETSLSLRNSLFKTWHGATVELLSRHEQAHLFCEEHLLGESFAKMLVAYRRLAEANQQADAMFGAAIEERAVRILRGMNWQLFQIRRKQETAESLEERTRKTHFRNMLRHWADKTSEQRQEQAASPSRSSRSMRFHQSVHRRDSALRETQRVDVDDTEGNDIVSVQMLQTEQAPAPATPAYLSRRSGRPKSRLPAPSTPATTQMTPLRNRLKALTLSNTRLGSARSEYASLRERDGPGRSVGIFDDIPETSPLRRDE